MARETVLVVHPDPDVREVLVQTVEREGRSVHLAGDAEAALPAAGRAPPDLVLAAAHLPGMQGLELLKILRERVEDVEAILLSEGQADLDLLVRARRLDLFAVLDGPPDPAVIGGAVRDALKVRRIRREASSTRSWPDPRGPRPQLVGGSESMQEIRRRIARSAASREPVLILGESGTGKELVARAIHDRSDRAEGLFEAVRLGSLLDTLANSALFGHLKGSFTGADTDHRGAFARASRGTLFLDEIGELKPELQPMMLTVLEEGEFRPLGSEEVQTTDARIIAATNRELSGQVEAGHFRRDLYYRLYADVLVLPPLREHMEDLEELAEHLLARAAHEEGAPDPPLLMPEALQRLHEHTWPGNVRELEKCLRRARLRAPRGVIRARHIELEIPFAKLAPLGPPGNPEALPTLSPTEPHQGPPRRTGSSPGKDSAEPWFAPNGSLLTLDELNRRYITEALRRTDGNVSEAARRLGVPRTTLRSRMQALGIERQG